MVASPRRRRSGAPGRARATGLTPTLCLGVGLVALDLLVYRDVGHFQFVGLADPVYITANAHVQAGLSWANIAWAFALTQAPTWHPLTWLSHMLDVQLFGLDAGDHHITNLVIHAATTVLLFGWLLHATGRRWPSAFVAAIFGIHPLHVESVAWVSERKDVLSAFFWMATLWAYVAYVDRPGPRRYLLVVLTFALGLLSKPTVVTLPVVLVLVDCWPLGRAAQPYSWSGWKRLIVEKVRLVVLSVAVSAVTLVVQAHGGALSTLETVPLGERLTNGVVSYVLYLGKFVWPRHLAVFYPLHVWPTWVALGACALLGALTLVVVQVRQTRPYLFVGWTWYLITLLPMIGFVQAGSQGMADRYMYLPMIGLLVAIAWGVPDLTAQVASWASRRLIPATAIAIVVALGQAAHVEASSWSDNIALWRHAIDNTPRNYLAYCNLGSALLDQGDLPGALSAFSTSLSDLDANWPLDEAMVRANIGEVLLMEGKAAEALAQFSRAAQLNPASVAAHDGEGQALAREGQLPEAMGAFQGALRLNPDLLDALLGIGNVLLSQNRAAEAIPYYMKAAQLQPRTAQVHNGLGSALALNGQEDDAKTEFEAALRLDPSLASADLNLAVLYAHEGNLGAARRYAERALALEPGYVPARQLLATLGRRPGPSP